MIYIYHDFGGTHSTSLDAAFHLKLLPPSTQKFTKQEILAVPFFNKLTKQDVGKRIFHGKDDDRNAVYTVARRRFKQIVPFIRDFYLLLEEKHHFDEKMILSNTSPTVSLAMTLGDMFSRGLGIIMIGVPLLVKGAQQSSETIFQLVEKTKQEANETSQEQVVILDNKEFQA